MAKAGIEKQKLRDDIAAERETGMAIAAFLLSVGTLGLSAGITWLAVNRRSESWIAFGIGAVVVAGAAVTFLSRPKLSDANDRYAKAHQPKAAPIVSGKEGDGPKICVLAPDRSRVTISKTDDVPLDWRSDGCVNGRTQYGSNAGTWSRTFAPKGEPTVTIQRYDPGKMRYTVERFLMSAEAMDRAREIRGRYTNNSCTADSAQRQSVADMETAIREILPAQPNERLVFDCHPASGGAKP